jgi:hypothetical protein
MRPARGQSAIELPRGSYRSGQACSCCTLTSGSVPAVRHDQEPSAFLATMGVTLLGSGSHVDAVSGQLLAKSAGEMSSAVTDSDRATPASHVSASGESR